MTTLPIDDVLPSLCDAVRRGDAVVLKAPPGAGKTTGVPGAVMQTLDQANVSGQIWVIQPRRLAARSVAGWLASQRGEPVGQTIGYHVRLDRKESERTRVLLMTTGMFLRRMQSDPLLEQVACVVLDEFHERTLQLDLALALTHQLRSELRDDLRLIVMSATLEPEPIVEFLRVRSPGDVIALQCDGRSYPVSVHHRGVDSKSYLDIRLMPIIDEALSATDGHVLVFLPGVGDIRRVESTWRNGGTHRDCVLAILHGSLSPADQDTAIRNTRQRKIILATNIAETSVTVDGVTAVVDSGLAKVPRFDARRGLTRLESAPISMASADQRAGRAGRTAPGVAYRMWTPASERGRDAYDVPEIGRSDLCEVVLLMAALGERDLTTLHWLTPPPAHAIDAASSLLRWLGAIDDDGSITTIGHTMAAMPLHPRIARLAMEATRFMPSETVALLAALLSERDPMEDVAGMTIAEKLDAIVNHRLPRNVSMTTVKNLRRIAQSIERSLPKSKVHRGAGDVEDASIARALLAAYPDRVVLRRSDSPDRGRMQGGRGVMGLSRIGVLHPTDEWLLCWDVDGGGSESRVRSAIAIDPGWLDESMWATREIQQWDDERSAVRCRRQRTWGDLVFSDAPAKVPGDATTAALLLENAWAAMPLAVDGLEDMIRRINLVAEVDESVPVVDDTVLRELLSQLCGNRSSLQALRAAPWADHLIGIIGYPAWQTVQENAPARLTLPGGHTAAIHYADGKPPWMEVKIQLCFGWRETPRILKGRVPVQLHLLGPNGRPQQITNDLASFWANAYIEIRKELRRRYPKHHWPEDPLSAVPSTHGMKPRST